MNVTLFVQTYKYGYELHVARWMQALLCSKNKQLHVRLNHSEQILFENCKFDITKVWPLLSVVTRHHLVYHDYSQGKIIPRDYSVFFSCFDNVMKALEEFATFNEATQNNFMNKHFPNEQQIVKNEHRYVTLLKRDTIVSLVFGMDPLNTKKWITYVLHRAKQIHDEKDHG